MNGKGSKPRSVNKKEFDKNFTDINWKKDNENTSETKVQIIKSKIGLAKRYVFK